MTHLQYYQHLNCDYYLNFYWLLIYWFDFFCIVFQACVVLCAYLCVCVTLLGVMHIHLYKADSGRREEKRTMERQNWASEWQSSPQPVRAWMSEEGLKALGQVLTSPAWILCLARQPHVNITSRPTHLLPPHPHCKSECSL